MVRVHRVVSGFGTCIEMKTLDYCCPYSLVRITYNVGKGEKTHYSYIGYDKNGRMFIKTKNPIAKAAQKAITRDFFSATYETKWNNNLK